MTDKDLAFILLILMLFQALISVFLSHGLNGKYFKDAGTYGLGLRKLRADKPIVGNAIIAIHVMVVCEFLFAFAFKHWG